MFRALIHATMRSAAADASLSELLNDAVHANTIQRR
jgi:hypothetical protein